MIINFIKEFGILFVELSVLFITITFFVSFLQRKVSPEKIRRMLSSERKWLGYFNATWLAAITPFCSCSTIPVLAGLLSAGAPFGPSITFLIASPFLDPIIFVLFLNMVGIKFTLIYAVLVITIPILAGILWDLLGLKKYVKNVRVNNAHQEVAATNVSSWKLAFQDAASFYKSVFVYLLIGVLVGAVIHDFIPESLFAKLALLSPVFMIMVASVIGIPMYVRTETMLPIAIALASKGVSIGAITALIIGGTGASIPEVILLNKLFKPRLVMIFVLTILMTAVISGLTVHFLF